MHVTENDQRLIALLQENARAPISELAQKLGLARTTVRNRLERLERLGVISGYRVELSDQYLGSMIEAHVLLKLDGKQQPEKHRKMLDLPEISELYSISGEYDFVARIKAESAQQLDQVLVLVRNLDGVVDTQSSIILTKWIQR
ncbi:MAG: Lrp/AsnC family transcriptional regulator [Caulobacterales bacterium]|nr:Lrp/AsnC family transcriptional regulator [Caulobacterales bacterium]